MQPFTSYGYIIRKIMFKFIQIVAYSDDLKITNVNFTLNPLKINLIQTQASINMVRNMNKK